MEMESFSGRMEKNTKGCFRMIGNMDRVCSIGLMGECIMGVGDRIESMGKECIRGLKMGPL